MTYLLNPLGGDMPYVAIINTPGYLPDGEPEVYETTNEAWESLAGQRLDALRDFGVYQVDDETYRILDQLSESVNPPEAVVYGTTPGYTGDHDLGIAYEVVEQ